MTKSVKDNMIFIQIMKKFRNLFSANEKGGVPPITFDRMKEMALYIHFENVDFRKMAWYSHHPEVQDNTTNQLSVL